MDVWIQARPQVNTIGETIFGTTTRILVDSLLFVIRMLEIVRVMLEALHAIDTQGIDGSS